MCELRYVELESGQPQEVSYVNNERSLHMSIMNYFCIYVCTYFMHFIIVYFSSVG
jgi:hypothetical protein